MTHINPRVWEVSYLLEFLVATGPEPDWLVTDGRRGTTPTFKEFVDCIVRRHTFPEGDTWFGAATHTRELLRPHMTSPMYYPEALLEDGRFEFHPKYEYDAPEKDAMVRRLLRRILVDLSPVPAAEIPSWLWSGVRHGRFVLKKPLPRQGKP